MEKIKNILHQLAHWLCINRAEEIWYMDGRGKPENIVFKCIKCGKED